MNKLSCIMLIDDNADDNFIHERVIRRCGAAEAVVVKQTGTSALEYLRSNGTGGYLHPSLIFLDINMPGMNGWEFLAEYERLDASLKNSVVVVMLTTSDNPDDRAKASAMNVATDFQTKPLTREMLEDIMGKYLGGS
jgi:CheY-like chemotaxis protein